MNENHGMDRDLSEDLTRRVDLLEERVLALEKQGSRIRGDDTERVSPGVEAPAPTVSPPPPHSSSPIRVQITSKRYDPAAPDAGAYTDHICWDVNYYPDGLEKPARAVKGVMEFEDLFGEVRFAIGVTVNERLSPGTPTRQVGIGFQYNQFREDHLWMLSTSMDDMCPHFRVQSILYEDGTRETVAPPLPSTDG